MVTSLNYRKGMEKFNIQTSKDIEESILIGESFILLKKAIEIDQ